jgi:spermidine/putrescine transport system substrate-binding protein
VTENEHFSLDPAVIRGLTQPRITRRDAIRYGGMAGLAAFMAACGTSASSTQSSGVGDASWWAKQKLHHQVNFGNWPLYVDVYKGGHPTLEHFTQETGIHVTYTEPIQDNVPFYTKIRPALQAGQYTGYDIIVMTNNSPPLGFLINAGWLVPLDHSMMTNFKKYAGPLVTNPAWDRGNKFTMAWQSGWTALAYNSSVIKEPIDSMQALYDPKYSGKIGMMADPQELGSNALLALGIEPAKSTPSDWQKAAAKLKAQQPHVRHYYDQDYINALKNGDTVISMAWSGDVFQANLNSQYRDLKFVFPKEGAMFWTDNMCIPKGVQNPKDAMTLMDYYYRPDVQAVVEYYVDYVCPVPSAKQVLLHPSGWAAKTLKMMRPSIGLPTSVTADAPTVFPNAHAIAVSRPYYQYKNPNQLTAWNNIFVPITQG